MKNYSDETLRCLRNCVLLDGAKNADGETIVRCIPTRPGERLLPKHEAYAQAVRVVNEVNEVGVLLSWHPELGDYVQVKTSTATYRFICRMKS